jgi:dihydroorotate dehydrogenase (fumarate)
VNLTAEYLGLELSSPIVPGASPMSMHRDDVRRLEEAGAAAIVLPSLFEEQIESEIKGLKRTPEAYENTLAEAATFAPSSMQEVFHYGPNEYLEHLFWMKETLSVPVIGSLNGTSSGGWLEYSKQMEQAGAAALELNLYEMATDPEVGGSSMERHVLEIVGEVRKLVKIPVAVKLSPYYSSLPHFAASLESARVDGLVLFNRFYQPDIDIENLKVERTLHLSKSSELLLRLRWLAVLSKTFSGSLAATGGIHEVTDIVKALMSGAHSVQVVSALLRHGPKYLATLNSRLERWLEEHKYDSVKQICGSMNLARCPDARAYERTNYLQILQAWDT